LSEFLAVYAERCEQAMMCQQLMIDMRQAPLLNSHTPHRAAQEVASLVLAHALIAQTRLQAAGVAGTGALRMWFGKTLVLVLSLWLTLPDGHGIITKKQAQTLTGQMLNFLSDTLLPPRRQRSCPRQVRQPVSSWPEWREVKASLGGPTLTHEPTPNCRFTRG